jgi:mannan endo-1,4-beta-mannosidase
VQRITPALQPKKGQFNEQVLTGLDLLLSEMAKRDMKAVLYLTNNWEWSGGFLQYLRWNNQINEETFRQKMDWDELRDQTSKFYSCTPCKEDYLKQVKVLLSRTNSLTKKKYKDDPTIMAWELANEPRPMRPAANLAYKQWINAVTLFIKSNDKNHLVTIGHEGNIGVDRSQALFEEIHAFENVDYLTIHIWPKNWSWFKDAASMEAELPQVLDSTMTYIDQHITIAQKLRKPLVIEEFGFPRDGQSFNVQTPTTLRDKYYEMIFSIWRQSKATNGVIAGANFWAFGGIARPLQGQIFWKKGDEYMGDPPMEEQGLNTVFDSDTTTWRIVKSFARSEN